MKEIKDKQVKNEFIQLLGEATIDNLAEDNWIGFDVKREIINKKLVDTNTIEINFFYKDGKGDKVIYSQICYNKDTSKWYCENFDEHELMFDSFEDLKNDLQEREAELMAENEQVITF